MANETAGPQLTEPPKPKLSIKSNYGLGGVWGVEKPEGYEVHLEEPLRKSLDLSFIPAEFWTVTVSTVGSGVAGWIVSKQCDALFTYLKKAIGSVGRKPKASLKIDPPPGHGPSLSVEFEQLDEDSLAAVKVTAREKLSKTGIERESEISIQFKPK